MDTFRFQLVYSSGQEFKTVRAGNPCDAWREIGALIARQGRDGCTPPTQVVLARNVEAEEQP
ncbi:MAG TPA: hypothetical protein VLA73_00650 [Burkholderiales bacterium]|nr:hypothetical protein [Burkholderiales bacterium]